MIPPIRFNVKTHHRIYPDTLLHYEMPRNKAAPVQSLQRYVIPDACFSYGRIYICMCVYTWLREIIDIPGFAMTSFFMVTVHADWPCPPSSANSSYLPVGKILPRRGRRNTSENAYIPRMSLSLVLQAIKSKITLYISSHPLFPIHCTDELISLSDTYIYICIYKSI